MYRRYVKRIIDVILSLVGLILASWLYLLIMIAIEIDDPGPVFFSQKRVGIHKKYFQLYKFRSMKMSTPHDMPTHLLENPEQYITRVGKFLRKTSLDEIPQLWNILRGDMSVIGPLESGGPAGRARQVRCQRCKAGPVRLGADLRPG